ncbi:hypothetical protein PAXRUDRAFT_16492 [Paxillus rubicundulus Ve08.2h10]|uniref:Uncharacterized protein n=1 Tax=Paxillus rubicundulus Ve08.2h10 TaxID=930991 RepID=A0A0D0C869_9AGAM|nr:hypothetical protein PAXRUDRAFT_16492 [Paxillus rubicundulus Ve08.2h10]
MSNRHPDAVPSNNQLPLHPGTSDAIDALSELLQGIILTPQDAAQVICAVHSIADNLSLRVATSSVTVTGKLIFYDEYNRHYSANKLQIQQQTHARLLWEALPWQHLH